MYSDTEYLNKLEIVRKLVGNYETIVGNFQDNGCLTVDELKAIYKQAEELGWI